MRRLMVVIILLTLSSSALCETIYVDINTPGGPGTGDGTPGTPFYSIQDGIGAAQPGDTVLVLPGTYLENIDFLSKAITLKSSAGPDSTTIDGNRAGPVVVFENSEGPDSVLDGFTITNGQASHGGGIFCYYSSPTLTCNVIRDNIAAGVYAYGGGIYCYHWCDPVITNNIISGNTARRGGGILFYHYCTPILTNNTITENYAWGTWSSDGGGGIHSSAYCGLTVTNSIFWGNTAVASGNELFCGPYYCNISYSDVEGGQSSVIGYLNWGDGMIDADPIFVDPGANDYRLDSSSPCADMGDNNAPNLPDFDFEGDPRIGNGIVDIGADELSGPPPNAAPIADAGVDQTVHQGETVVLDGSGSTDPDGNYPLEYSWQILSMPQGSSAILSGPDTVAPSFTADKLGDYDIQLVVTDSLGEDSVPDTVVVSTFNTAPVADAGPDQAIIVLGTTVQLDGSQSWDDDGDDLSYSWEIVQKPGGSSAELSDSTSVDPTFVADVQGEYKIILVVNDGFVDSEPDEVTVSFTNVKPVADAGENQAVWVGTMVNLDGSGSSDANGDELTYNWNLVSIPGGSTAELANPTSVQSSFVADLPGEYIVSLVVNDGFENSDPANVTIMAVVTQESVILVLMDAMDAINGLSPSDFKNKNLKKTLTNKINAVLKMIDEERYADAQDKLVNDILKKMDGCATSGYPDKNDWITTCSGQEQVCPLIEMAIDFLDDLID